MASERVQRLIMEAKQEEARLKAQLAATVRFRRVLESKRPPAPLRRQIGGKR